MKHKNRIIPNVPKEERSSFNFGYHNLPNWLIVLLSLILFIGMFYRIFY